MRLLSGALRAAQGFRTAALPPRSSRAAPVGGSAAGTCPLQPRRGLSARPCFNELFAAPSLRRLLEARAQGGAGPELAARIQLLRDKEQELRDTRELARQDESEDFQKLAEREITSCEEEIAELKQQIVLLLIPSEETDKSDLVMEVTSGVGGQEAMLFTSEIFDMYQRYAAYKKWKFEVLEYFPSEIGHIVFDSLLHVEGLKEGSKIQLHEGMQLNITNWDLENLSTGLICCLYSHLEKGRPSSPMKLQINLKDLRIETKRASGAGGQHVNTTDSAVRIVHIPTVGKLSILPLSMTLQKHPDQFLRMLYLSFQIMEKKLRNRIGTKGRSEKIRTYNFPQDRITDHRISRSVHHIECFMLGEEMLDEMIQTVREYADYESLMEIISENEK
ncbi:RF1ML factor, partial [Corythaeola cristata]|nr:RF1ML factor [Corythaeola cristata]